MKVFLWNQSFSSAKENLLLGGSSTDTEGWWGLRKSSEFEVEKTEHIFKILVVGDIATGKTCLIKRYVHGIFTNSYKSTIGVEFALKVIQWQPNVEVQLQLWDIAGQERFTSMTRVFYKEAVGAVVVFDATRPATFTAAAKWKADIDGKLGVGHEIRKIPIILLANKIDLDHPDMPDKQTIQRFCEDHKFDGWFETSAKENIGIDQSMKFLVSEVLEDAVTMSKTAIATEGIRLRQEEETKTPKFSRECKSPPRCMGMYRNHTDEVDHASTRCRSTGKQPLDLIFFRGWDTQEESAPLLGERRMIQNGAELQSSLKIKRSPG
ncbi:Rab GTPase [Planoprotostelium fungivorum]|uniref:Ras-related protein Rab n=1 Tax=Planoprotostelium fungivorum TaxID=1890364 RepID=A0A2P6N7R9_9EUKA|nr:Rab GTPase [Planoprotostelium fungivorum]